ncbi:hypothetical protein SEA_ARCADIA_64 [Arthrobacter phage Arcadia]|uniref:Uncharacterized protein n=1 Tax=Arthrobacter phage Arcadia TaxID=2024274 RepID=A0A222Z7U5_9CAUD|nr:hypothetical protein PQB74_gp64 [Arthrobacter phage Arcadia]ASR80027.1 hypothetical protein SEA_ARCADIA_64 [Arthrobacter phage Arcadia]ASR80220.1 hypothetical protein SEA_ELSA_64 [Arthrobacter phage Elsa]ASR80417.1 hypothetical protein SEA_NASON_64 [Arthrobacter phage Nason]
MMVSGYSIIDHQGELMAQKKKETSFDAGLRFERQYPGTVHEEPRCLGFNRCKYMEPHNHGFECDKTCEECWGLCHPECPANIEESITP